MKQLRAIIIGAGGRGSTFAQCMADLPEQYKVVGVADPEKPRREKIQKMFGLPGSACYVSWEELLAQPKMADIAVIATMDDMHYEPAMKAIELRYHLLLKSPWPRRRRSVPTSHWPPSARAFPFWCAMCCVIPPSTSGSSSC